jgi:predicted enzyme related to lactoylglutathione lyase
MSKHLPGTFVWYELLTGDAAKAKAFYGELFGWKSQSFPMGPGTSYEMIIAGDAMIGGYAPVARGERPQWIACLSVDDVDAAARAAAAHGGRIVEPPADIPNAGRRARIDDPAGATIYLYRRHDGDQPDTGVVPAGRFLWNELHTPDPAASLAFYAKVAGLEHRPMPMGDEVYHVVGKGGVDRGGASHHLEPGYPAHWLPYVVSDDPDATLARAHKLGGQVRMPAFTIPGVGRIGVLQDPTGAVLAVMKPMPLEARGAPG